jgi:hypothetical protein
MNFSHREETVESSPRHHGDSQWPKAELPDQPGRTELPDEHPVPERHVEVQQQNQEAHLSENAVSQGRVETRGALGFPGREGRSPALTGLSRSLSV